jgi:hypothetical protein
VLATARYAQLLLLWLLVDTLLHVTNSLLALFSLQMSHASLAAQATLFRDRGISMRFNSVYIIVQCTEYLISILMAMILVLVICASACGCGDVSFTMKLR